MDRYEAPAWTLLPPVSNLLRENQNTAAATRPTWNNRYTSMNPCSSCLSYSTTPIYITAKPEDIFLIYGFIIFVCTDSKCDCCFSTLITTTAALFLWPAPPPPRPAPACTALYLGSCCLCSREFRLGCSVRKSELQTWTYPERVSPHRSSTRRTPPVTLFFFSLEKIV